MDGDMRPIVLPKFMSDPESFENFGYQTAHLYYDEMRKFFARKASAEHQNEVVIIKFAMMTLKPGNRTPQIVSVSDSPELSIIVACGTDAGVNYNRI